jgi:benzodiazapine receptor
LPPASRLCYQTGSFALGLWHTRFTIAFLLICCGASPKMRVGQSSLVSSLSQWFALALCLIICLATAGLGAALTSLSVGDWYAGLNKPSWNPPNWIFAPVWTTLYIGMAIAAWLVWRRKGMVGAWLPLLLFGLQLFFNAAWSALFFGMRNPGIALINIVLLWFAILATIISFRRISNVAAALLVPYFAWVSFATALNWSIWRLNT